MKAKTAENYLKLPYHIEIHHVIDESGDYYTATVLELEGCVSHGDTQEEALKNIHEAMEGCILALLDEGFPVPLPINDDKFSGRVLIRLPKSLHAKLTLEAKREGISFNQYALYKLSSA